MGGRLLPGGLVRASRYSPGWVGSTTHPHSWSFDQPISTGPCSALKVAEDLALVVVAEPAAVVRRADWIGDGRRR